MWKYTLSIVTPMFNYVKFTSDSWSYPTLEVYIFTRVKWHDTIYATYNPICEPYEFTIYVCENRIITSADSVSLYITKCWWYRKFKLDMHSILSRAHVPFREIYVFTLIYEMCVVHLPYWWIWRSKYLQGKKKFFWCLPGFKHLDGVLSKSLQFILE